MNPCLLSRDCICPSHRDLSQLFGKFALTGQQIRFFFSDLLHAHEHSWFAERGGRNQIHRPFGQTAFSFWGRLRMKRSKTQIPAKLKTTLQPTPPKTNRRQNLGRCWVQPTRLQRIGSRAPVRKTPGDPAVRAANWEPMQFRGCRANMPTGPLNGQLERRIEAVKPSALPDVLNPGPPQKTSTTSPIDPVPLQNFSKTKKIVPCPGRTGARGSTGSLLWGIRNPSKGWEGRRFWPPPTPQCGTPSSDEQRT